MFQKEVPPFFENLNTEEIKFYGEQGRKILELSSKAENSIEIYEKASKFFMVKSEKSTIKHNILVSKRRR